MAESNLAFLNRLEGDSRKQQQAFIQNIASRLGRLNEGGIPEHPLKGAPDFWTSYELDYEERILRFMDNWRAAGGFTERLATYDELPVVIARTLRELGAQSLIRQNQPELAQLEFERILPELQHTVWSADKPQQALVAASQADAGIAIADYAVAYTGSVVMTSSKDKGRSVTLLPNIFIAIVPAERLKTR
ncbi:LutC/YkgG family protein [Paenibacillus pini]|uniref:L-lactate dehydrogenase n=1 Tax=Paenibacillus pini JCM 16418 TaxID=1236976 RepID=W7YDW4_9BACL|nr:LUD domain-containing protein [Paenibacillus pini]GAF06662.1 L-lactate dehydrogenase [Paenibacillus pini JCM 16418]